MSDSLQPYGLQPTRALYPWDSPAKNNGVGCHALPQGVFPTQGSNMCLLCLLHWHVGSLLLPHLGRWEFLGNFGIIWKRIYKIVKGFTGILYNNFNHIIFLEKYRKHPKLTKSGEGKETCYNSNHLQPEQHDQTCPIHTLYVLKYGYIY